MNYFIVFNKFTLTTLHRVLDQWKKLKMREQVSSLCCANVLSPLSCWLWSLSHRHKEHNHLNSCFSVKEWKRVSGCPIFAKWHECVHQNNKAWWIHTEMDFFPPWNECVFMIIYLYVFPISEIREILSPKTGFSLSFYFFKWSGYTFGHLMTSTTRRK